MRGLLPTRISTAMRSDINLGMNSENSAYPLGLRYPQQQLFSHMYVCTGLNFH